MVVNVFYTGLWHVDFTHVYSFASFHRASCIALTHRQVPRGRYILPMTSLTCPFFFIPGCELRRRLCHSRVSPVGFAGPLWPGRSLIPADDFFFIWCFSPCMAHSPPRSFFFLTLLHFSYPLIFLWHRRPVGCYTFDFVHTFNWLLFFSILLRQWSMVSWLARWWVAHPIVCPYIALWFCSWILFSFFLSLSISLSLSFSFSL